MTEALLVIVIILLVIDILVRLHGHHVQKLHVKSLKESLEKCVTNLYFINQNVEDCETYLKSISGQSFTGGPRW